MSFPKLTTRLISIAILYICIGFFQAAYGVYPFAGRKRFLLKGIFSISFAIFAFFIFALPALGATRTWDGSDSTSWTLDANWAEGTAPTSTDDVVINGSYTNAPTLDLSGGTTTINSLAIGSSATSVLTVSNGNDTTNKLTVTGDITIGGSGTITHTTNTSAETNKLNIEANNITIDSGGKIDVNEKGYSGGYGPGVGGFTNGGLYRHGGGYGGPGGASGGSAYGSLTQPINLGSGGADSGCKAGGGAIKLSISGTATINGTISSNGGNSTGSYYVGPGSGGSVWVITGTLTGSGSIITNGGTGESTGRAGAGGGGRISIQYTTDSFSGTIAAYGGVDASAPGAAGTIYKKSPSDTYGNLFINNNNQSSSRYTPLLITGGNNGGDALWRFDNEWNGVTNGG